MKKIVNHLELENIELKSWIAELSLANQLLKDRLDEATNTISLLQEQIQCLRDEIAVLKKQKPRPKIPPNTLEGPNSLDKQDSERTTRGKHPRKKKDELIIHEIIRLKPESLPEGAVFKGTQKYTVQDIRFESHNVVFERERWLLPDGTYVSAELPQGINGHYGVELQAYVLDLHYSCRVTEPLLLQNLHSRGVKISAGQLSRILLERKDIFHQEKQELLPAGIDATGQIQVDDIGARHAGKNSYTTVICNALFAFFVTTSSKSRVNFLQVLHAGEPKYLLNEDSWAYIREQNPSSRLLSYLEKDCPGEELDQKSFDDFLKQRGIESEGRIRLATEAALFASLIERGIPRDLRIHADDAGQFAVFILSLCWIHEERHYRKFQVYQAETAETIAKVRGQIWELYRGLQSYKKAPSESERLRLEQEFDTVFQQKTPSSLLNERLALTHEKKARLLVVLDHPSTPLHNNATETDGRSGVVLKKVSGGTRSEEGKKARDTFLSLKQTARKLGISFLAYLKDRLSGKNEIVRLSALIRGAGCQPAGP
jgi:Transposase IS66 family